jgi:hypothetical protein
MPERHGSGVTAEEIINKMVEVMRENCEEFPDHKLAPASFHVYLRKEDYERIEGILGEIEGDAERILDQELMRLNKEVQSIASEMEARSPLRKLFNRVLNETGLSEARRRPKMYDPPKAGWSVMFIVSSDSSLGQKKFEVVAQLTGPKQRQLSGDNLTVIKLAKREGKVLTDRDEAESAIRGSETDSQMTVSSRVFARISYIDAQGKHTFEMRKPSIVIGRGGPDVQVDLRLDAPLDVSREHLLIRRDQASGHFYLKDMSLLGSTINGELVPGSLEIVNEVRRDRNQEVILPPRARIELGGVIALDFEVA